MCCAKTQRLLCSAGARRVHSVSIHALGSAVQQTHGFIVTCSLVVLSQRDGHARAAQHST
jgi:hypothetical protein